MSTRLALKYGVVSEEDRLANSSDAILVTEPTTGSKLRTKGSLYLVVTCKVLGAKARDACHLVADTIRREYYYDESAGISIVLEKAIRAANRRLRHSREGSGLTQGAIGVAAAVVRGNELYVATAGDAESYLIRAARLLMPEHEPGEGLPAPDTVRIDVWRGDFSVGDSLLLCSRNLVEVVGTEELKNAVVTLHPQSAVEHLHHLFVAAGGEGSDAVLTIEASEVSLARVEHRLVPVSPSEPLAGAPERSPIPMADQLSGAAAAIQERAVVARLAVRDGISHAISRVLDLTPRRRTNYRRLGETAASRRDTQRRAAIAVLAFIGVTALLGVVMYAWNPLRQETPLSVVTEGEAAFADAREKADRVFGSGDLIRNDPTEATNLLQSAWAALGRAQSSGVVTQTSINQQRARVSAGLDELYGTIEITPSQLYAAQASTPLSHLVRGPDEAAYVISGSGVVRIDSTTGAAATIVQEGAGVGVGLSAPGLLAHGGPDLLIYDDGGALWRWRPSDDAGGGTIGQVSVAGEQVWGDSVVDIETFLINPDLGLYRLYVPFPPTEQILKYDPTADGGGFSAPSPYFVSEGENVSAFHELLVDGDVYGLTSDNLLRYFNGRRSGFEIVDPPDDGDLRPGHQYQLIGATGTRGVGHLFVWDAEHGRVIEFDKTDGTYVAQYVPAADAPQLSDLTGMYIIEPASVQVAPTLVYSRADGVYQVTLGAPEVTPSAPPVTAPPQTEPPDATPTPTTSEPPQTATPEPTRRPRRTPQP
jgi:hypothetical protein